MSEPAIEVRQLSHTFPRGVQALTDVSLAARPGEFISLVGPSGCGKSTVLRVLAGLLRPTSGEACVRGEPVAGRPGRVAFMPQKDLLLPWRKALDNAALGASIAGESRGQAKERAAALFERFGLAGFEQAWPSQLSGGMRQRLALLRTFLMPQDVLLLDEPFGALDAITRRRMYLWLEEVWERDQRTVLFVTHDVEEALLLSDRVIVMSQRPGRIIDSVDVPFERPRRAGLLEDPDFLVRKSRLLRALGLGTDDDAGTAGR